MKKQIILGQLRELLTFLGALAFAGFSGWQAVTGLVVAAASIAWALWHHEGGEIIYTAARKWLSLLPAAAVQFGWLTPGTAAAVLPFIGPAAAALWSFIAKTGKPPGTGFSLPLLAAALAMGCLPSCSPTAGRSMPLLDISLISHKYGTDLNYSSKGGLRARFNADKIIDRNSGK